MGRHSFIKSLAGICLAALAVWAQQQDVIIRTEVRLVRVLTNVRDAAGNLVGDLSKEEFEVLDNGVPQQVSIFERQTEQPLSVSLLIDISASTAKDLPIEVSSLQRFVDEFF